MQPTPRVSHDPSRPKSFRSGLVNVRQSTDQCGSVRTCMKIRHSSSPWTEMAGGSDGKKYISPDATCYGTLNLTRREFSWRPVMPLPKEKHSHPVPSFFDDRNAYPSPCRRKTPHVFHGKPRKTRQELELSSKRTATGTRLPPLWNV